MLTASSRDKGAVSADSSDEEAAMRVVDEAASALESRPSMGLEAAMTQEATARLPIQARPQTNIRETPKAGCGPAETKDRSRQRTTLPRGL